MRCLLLLGALLGLAGCEQEKAPSVPASPLTPQARFDRVVDQMRKELEGQTIGTTNRVTIRDGAGVGNTAWSYQVDASSKISKPTTKGDRYTASIKVTFETTYTSRRRQLTEKEEEKTKNKKEKASLDRRRRYDDNTGNLGDSDSDQDTEVLDNDLIGELPGTLELSADDHPLVINSQTRKAVKVTLYKLEYRNDRWVLAVPPPHDALSTANDSMRRALKRQG